MLLFSLLSSNSLRLVKSLSSIFLHLIFSTDSSLHILSKNFFIFNMAVDNDNYNPTLSLSLPFDKDSIQYTC
jgi:hypothetical protein